MADHEAIRGVIHGKIIQLDTEIGLPDGQEVTVSVRPLAQAHELGSGIRQSAGAWADDNLDELEAYLEANRRARQLDRQGIEP